MNLNVSSWCGKAEEKVVGSFAEQMSGQTGYTSADAEIAVEVSPTTTAMVEN